MSEFKDLSVKATQELESASVPVQNHMQSRTETMALFIKLLHWASGRGLRLNAPQKDVDALMVKLLGFKPTYYRNYRYRTAVWGLTYQGTDFVLYLSKRGLALQVSLTAKATEVGPLLKQLNSELGLK